MKYDIGHQKINFQYSELEHKYHKQVHILNHPVLVSYLNDLAYFKTEQPLISELTKKIYTNLASQILSYHLKRKVVEQDTRMKKMHAEGRFVGEVIDRNQKAVVVAMARAGTQPSEVFYQELNYLLSPHLVRQDHIYISRVTNEQNQVMGASFSGSKIGGDVDGSLVFIPDPMGATGSSMHEVLTHYKQKVGGQAVKFIAIHLIITPEYVRKMSELHPDLEIYTVRLDRGFSTEKALKSMPGTHPKEEQGLNSNHYIVPGAGGVGEILNNSY
ncbi:MAG: hypothetical protein JNM93_01500 [Bacteriovoracaceae bacterium]|nr:hypothetical protein [Bacteriovoracaceae bacterium]